MQPAVRVFHRDTDENSQDDDKCVLHSVHQYYAIFVHKCICTNICIALQLFVCTTVQYKYNIHTACFTAVCLYKCRAQLMLSV